VVKLPKAKKAPKKMNRMIESIYAKAISKGASKEKAAKMSWGGAKLAGYKKGKGGQWSKKKK